MASVPQTVPVPEATVPMVPSVGPVRSDAAERGEQRFLIRDIDWATYRTIADALVDRHYHMSYDGEDLELMTISDDHGRCSRILGDFVFVLTEEHGLPRRSCGDMTMSREDLERGIESDESFYIANEPKVRGRKINLTVDPPPDLGIEVDLTTDSRRRLGIYAKIGVPEIWRYDGEQVTILQRQPGGDYAVADKSRCFRFLLADDLGRFLQQRDQVEEGALLRSFRAWVREQTKKSTG